ncbi:hypothetical protein [Exercitatus varius]|uniref:O-antigen polymerase n=1 Tax=Exercitatus varius TaxID=67857 RepID=A0AAW6QB63_9PAST|nr:hypothetical protein [Exercitatus varius]MDG2949976.1 hypothetical protein [Exercitatus varius]
MHLVLKKDSTVITSMMFFILMFGDFFHLVNSESILPDVFLLFYAIWCIWQAIKLFNYKVEYAFLPFILMLIVSIFIAVFQAYYVNGQPFLLGLRPQRGYLILLLSYFPIRKLFFVYDVDIERLFKKIMFWASLSTLLYFTCKYFYLTRGIEILYLGVHYTGTFSAYRMYIESSLIDLAILLSIFFYLKTFKFKYLIPAILGMISQVWISQGRLELLAILAGIIIGVLFTKKTPLKKIVIFFISILGFIVFLNSSVFESIWLTLTGQSEVNNTLEIRQVGKTYYIEQILESIDTFLFGVGYPNMLYVPAWEKTGFYDNIFLSDNGLISFAYMYGIFGVIAILGLFLKFIKGSFLILRYTHDQIYLMFIVMISVMSINIIFWYWHMDALLILILMLCGLEQTIYKVRKNG